MAKGAAQASDKLDHRPVNYPESPMPIPGDVNAPAGSHIQRSGNDLIVRPPNAPP